MKIQPPQEAQSSTDGQFPTRTPYTDWISLVAEKWRKVCASDAKQYEAARNKIHAKIVVARIKATGSTDGDRVQRYTLAAETAWDDAEAAKMSERQRKRLAGVFSEDQRNEALAMGQTKIVARNGVLQALGWSGGLSMDEVYARGMRRLGVVGAIMANYRIVPPPPNKAIITNRRPLTDDEHKRKAEAADRLAEEMCP